MARGTRILACVVALLSVGFLSPLAGASSPRGALCHLMASAPDDRSLLCVALRRDPATAVPTGVDVAVSHDQGRTWASKASTGVLLNLPSLLSQVVASANFGADQTWYLQTSDTGVYKSTDDGGTWVLFDPFAPQPSVYASLTPVLVDVPVLGPRSALAFANPLSPVSALLDTPAHIPVPGSADINIRFLAASPGSARYSGRIFVAATHSDPANPASNHAVIYSCTAFYACATPVFTASPGLIYEGAVLHPDFARTGLMAVWLRDFKTARVCALLSRDGGASFQQVKALQPVLDKLFTIKSPARQVATQLAFDPTRNGRIYARVTFKFGGDYPQQLWRSEDYGARWTLLGKSYQVGSKLYGTLPWGSSGYSPPYDSANIRVDRQGRVNVVAVDPAGAGYAGFFCSPDGKKWSHHC